MSDPTPRQQRARVAALSRRRQSDDPELMSATAQLRATMLEEHIRKVVDGWPPLTSEQRARLAGILLTGREAM